MKVVVDNNLPRRISRLLAASGLEAVHVGELGSSPATDQALRQPFSLARDHPPPL
ncbi:MAG: DUF5615 family PIN-like protein [Candidatus Omnitrophica bacterium]|nr:DUF5615 family PIN-like protein [Candidatus Omnitrophota bacterium]